MKTACSIRGPRQKVLRLPRHIGIGRLRGKRQMGQGILGAAFAKKKRAQRRICIRLRGTGSDGWLYDGARRKKIARLAASL